MSPDELIKSLKKVYVWIPSNVHAKVLMKEIIIKLGGRCD